MLTENKLQNYSEVKSRKITQLLNKPELMKTSIKYTKF